VCPRKIIAERVTSFLLACYYIAKSMIQYRMGCRKESTASHTPKRRGMISAPFLIIQCNFSAGDVLLPVQSLICTAFMGRGKQASASHTSNGMDERPCRFIAIHTPGG